MPFSPDHVQSEAGRFGWKKREHSLRWPVRPVAIRIQEPLAFFFPASNRGARERTPGKHCRAVGGREWGPSYFHEPPGMRVLSHVASCWLPSTKGQGQCAGCRATSSRTRSSQHAQPPGVFDLLLSSQLVTRQQSLCHWQTLSTEGGQLPRVNGRALGSERRSIRAHYHRWSLIFNLRPWTRSGSHDDMALSD